MIAIIPFMEDDLNFRLYRVDDFILHLQYGSDCDFDYTIYTPDNIVLDGGQIDNEEMSMEEAVEAILSELNYTVLSRLEDEATVELLDFLEDYNQEQEEKEYKELQALRR